MLQYVIMNGILLVNHFLNGEKFNELHIHLVKSAKKQNINLVIKTNLELAADKVNTDFVLLWDKDINLARRIEKGGVPVFNSSSSVAVCDDKARTYIELSGIVPQPKTLVAPKTYFHVDMSEFVDTAIEHLGLPLVFKECFGSFGEQVYLCKNREDVMSHITAKPFILQEFIADSAGSDTRIEIVGGKFVSAVKRNNPADFRSNVTNGGTMTPVVPDNEMIETARKACEVLGLTFGGVDILDNGMVCEVNSNAHIINIMNATGIDIAPIIFNGITEQLK